MFLSVFLSSESALVQASAMLFVCIFALFLQIRLRPYDDSNHRNIFNNADALLGNNHLEQILITLQIAQLALGIVSVSVLIPDPVLTALYISLFVMGICFSLVALSNRFAKVAEGALKSVDPIIAEVKQHFGLSGVSDHVHANNENKRLAAEKLLAAARTYEQSTVARVGKGQVFEHMRHSTRASEYRKRALLDRKEERLTEKHALRRESIKWEQRKAVDGNTTHADELGHFAEITAAMKNNTAAQKADKIARNSQTKDALAAKEKSDFIARRRTSKTGGGFATDVEAFHRSSVTQNTVACEERHKALDEEHDAKLAEAEFAHLQTEAWQKRQEHDGHATKTDELGHFAAETRTSIYHKQAREDEKKTAIALALAEEERRKGVAILWERRRNQATKNLLREENSTPSSTAASQPSSQASPTSSLASSIVSGNLTKPSKTKQRSSRRVVRKAGTDGGCSSDLVAAVYSDAARKSRASGDTFFATPPVTKTTRPSRLPSLDSAGGGAPPVAPRDLTGRHTAMKFSAEMV